MSSIYYSDTTISRERLDLLNEKSYTIIDFKNLKQYVISKGQILIEYKY
jgi:hypothetical protein